MVVVNGDAQRQSTLFNVVASSQLYAPNHLSCLSWADRAASYGAKSGIWVEKKGMRAWLAGSVCMWMGRNCRLQTMKWPPAGGKHTFARLKKHRAHQPQTRMKASSASGWPAAKSRLR